MDFVLRIIPILLLVTKVIVSQTQNPISNFTQIPLPCMSQKHTLIELRHDCSGREENPIITRPFWTSVVYRLKSPVVGKCSQKLDKRFTWHFNLEEPVDCLAMLGCHDLEGIPDPHSRKEIFEFNVTVNKLTSDGKRLEKQSFQIKEDGTQKFYKLTGGESVQMSFQYHSQAKNRQRSIICFAWCNKKLLKTPPERIVREPEPQVPIEKILQGLNDPKRQMLELDQDQENFAISPVSVYKIGEGSRRTCKEFDGRCYDKYSFFWQSEHDCYANALCTKLEGDICDTYGIEFQPGNKQFYDAKCYFWCTKDGDLPEPPKEENLDKELLEKLASGKWLTREIVIGKGWNDALKEKILQFNISPVVHYQLTQENGQACQSDTGSIEGPKNEDDNVRRNYKMTTLSKSKNNIRNYCSKSTTFVWNVTNGEPCKGKFICSKLDGNICGDFGINAIHSGANDITKLAVLSKTAVCHEAQVVDVNLQPTQEFRVEYWFRDKLRDNIECHFWCNELGEHPTPLPEGHLGDNLLDELLSNKNIIRDIQPEDVQEVRMIPLSSSLVYKIGWNDLRSLRDISANTITIKFSWLRNFASKLSILCTNLGQNACGDSRISISVMNDAYQEDICYNNKLYTRKLFPGDGLTFSSRSAASTLNATCFLWSTLDGNIPSIFKEANFANTELLSSLVSGKFRLVNLNQHIQSSISKDLYVSPLNIYELSVSGSGTDCKNESCSRSLPFHWFGDNSCKFSAVCTKMSNYPCGDYAISINGKQDVCFENQKAYKIVNEGESINLQFWLHEKAEFQTRCFMFCDSISEEDSIPDENVTEVLLGLIQRQSLEIGFNIDTLTTNQLPIALSSSKIYKLHLTSETINMTHASCNGQKCQFVALVAWYHDEPAIVNLLNTALLGEVGGSYGLEFSINGVLTYHAYQKEKLYSLKITDADVISIKFWFVKNTSFELTSYIWATTTGELPSHPPDMNINEHVIEELIEGRHLTQKIYLSDSLPNTTMGISPFTVYLLNISNDEARCDSGNKCALMSKLQLFSLSKCKLSSICSSLGSNPCGNFGLKYGQKDSTKTDVCHVGDLQQQDIENNDVVGMFLWYLKEAKFKVHCYFWCTETGDLPPPKPTNVLQQQHIQDILENRVEQLYFNEIIAKDYFLSSANIYQLTKFFASRTQQALSTDNVLELSVDFKRAFDSIFSLFCVGFTENACGDYGVQLVSSKKVVNICYEGSVTEAQISLNNSVTVKFWYRKDIPREKDFSCYLWSTKTGEMPSKLVEGVTPLTREMIEQLANLSLHTVPVSFAKYSTLTLSPTKIYKILTSAIECNEFFCHETVTLQWLHGKGTQVHLFLSQLDENVCGEYGLNVRNIKPDSQETFEICYTGQIFTFEIRQDSLLEFEFWYIKHSSHNLSGFFWVSDDKNLPYQEQFKENNDLLTSLLQSTANLQEVNIVSLKDDLIPKSTTIYNIIAHQNHLPFCNERVCQLNRKMTNLQLSSCQFKMVCSILEENPCGAFGLHVKLNSKETKMCYRGQLVHEVLEPSESLEISLWYSPQTRLNISCFAWCTFDGNLPRPHPGRNIKSELLTQLMEKNFKLKSVDEPSRITAMSSQVVYYTQGVSEDNVDCGKTMCFKNYSFQWYGQEQCLSKFVCTELSDNVCSDFGVIIESKKEKKEVCFDHVIIENPLQTKDSLKLTLWFHPNASFNYECFLWCTDSGTLPGPSPPENVALINKLLNTSANVIETALLSKSLLMSQRSVYHFSWSEIKAECEDQSHCSNYTQLQLYSHNNCQARFLCDQLSENICGDNGLTLSFSSADDLRQNNHVICEKGFAYENSFYPHDSLDISFWYLNGASVNVSCYLWCTSDGSLPEKPESNLINQDIILELTTGSRNLVKVNLNERDEVIVSKWKIYNIYSTCIEDRCEERLRFTWLNSFSDQCNYSFVCTDLAADVSLSLSQELETFNILYEGVATNGVLKLNDSLDVDVSLWRAESSVSCFFWCKNKDQIEDQESGKELLEKFLLELANDTYQTQDVKFEQDLNIPLSPHEILYFVDQNSNALSLNLEGLVRKSATFTNRRDKSCEAHFFCNSLEGNTCGTFGIQITSSRRTENVCQPKRIYKFNLNPGASLSLTLWALNEAPYRAECYLWCSTDGALPRKKPESNVNDLLLEDLMDSMMPILPITLEENGSKSALSPASVYEIHVETALTMKNCSHKSRCTLKKHIMWNNPETEGEVRLLCTHLSSTFCADHGIYYSIKRDDRIANSQKHNHSLAERKEVCHERVLYSDQIEYADCLEVVFWLTKPMLPKMTCYIWITPNGELPSLQLPEIENSILDELVQSVSVPKTMNFYTNETKFDYLSTSAIYSIKKSNEALGSCKQGKICSVSKRFEYIFPRECQMRLTCVSFGSPEPCGLFGLMGSLNGSTFDVCKSGHIYDGSLSVGKQLVVRLWYAQPVTFELNCYLWCTESGEIPQPPKNKELIGKELLTQLANGSEHFMSVVSNDEPDGFQPLNINTIYVIEFSHGSHDDCIKNENDVCEEEYVFKWLRPEESCNVSVVCTDFVGTICGSIGVNVRFGSASSELCYKNQALRGKITKNDDIRVNIWYAEDISTRTTCFLWCSEKGNFPSKEEADGKEADEDLINSLLNSSALTYPITFDSRKQECNVSPKRIYQISGNSKDLSCSEKLCQFKHVLRNERPSECRFKMICSKLTGNPCEDYGLSFSQQEICSTGHIYATNLKPNETIDLNLWFSNQADLFSFHCHSWCTEDGQLPTSQIESAIGSNLIEKIISQQISLTGYGFKDTSSVDFISSSSVTHIQLFEQDFESNYRFNQKLLFKWLGETECKLSFICGKLEGNVGGDYGINVHDTNGTKEIHCPGTLFTKLLSSSQDSFEIDLWVARTNDLLISCYLWCSTDGEPPRPPPAADVTEELTLDVLNASNILKTIITSSFATTEERISFLNIYHITMDQSTLERGCKDSVCKTEVYLSLASASSCSFGFVCPNLPKDSCASNGIRLDSSSLVEPLSYCHEGVIVQGKHEFGDQMSIEIWYTNYTKSSPDCYFWCTKEGDVPASSQDLIFIDENTLLQLVNGSMNTKRMNVSSNKNYEPIVENKVYELVYDKNLLCNCDVFNSTIQTHFIWFGKKTCHGKIVCNGFGENVWGDHGVLLTKNKNNSQSVSRNGGIYQTSLNTDDAVHITYWSLRNNQKSSLKCYFWCGTTEIMELTNEKEDNKRVLEALTKATLNEKYLTLQSADEENENVVSISPKTMYQVALNSSSWNSTAKCSLAEGDQVAKCRKSLTLQWLWEHSCEGKFVCEDLSGYTCGDHVLSVQYPNEDEGRSVCRAGKVFEGILSFASQTKLSLWHTEDAQFSIRCMFWCTKDGRLPNLDEAVYPDENLLLHILNETSITKEITGRNNTISHSVIYASEAKSGSEIPYCSDGICKVSAQFAWNGETICRANIFCPILEDNPCADFGISVRYPDFENLICTKDYLYQHSVAPGKTFTAELWYTKNSNISWKCYFWCTKSGLPPRKHQNDFQFDHDVEALISKPVQVTDVDLSTSSSLVLSVAQLYILKASSAQLTTCNSTTKCFSSTTLEYYGLESCQAVLKCSKLRGNPCGDYELSARFPESSHDICYENSVVQSKFTSGNELELYLWWSKDASFDMVCYFWCSLDGHIPQYQKEFNNSKVDKLLLDLMQGREKFYEVPVPAVIDENEYILAISKAAVYQIRLSNRDLKSCMEDRCSFSYEFQWFLEEDCKANFVCSQLSGNTCGDYGLSLIFPSNTSQSVCYTEQLYTQDISFYTTTRLSLWYLRRSEFAINCFFWCSYDGELPQILDPNDTDENVIETLANTTFQTIELEFAKDRKVITPLSPYNIYFFKYQDQSFEDCSEPKCYVSSSFKWYGSENCTLSVICNKMGDNVCGSHGFEIKVQDDESSSICYPEKLFKHNVTNDGIAKLSLWYTGEWNHQLACFVWCTKDGNLPKLPTFEQLSDPVINNLLSSNSSITEISLFTSVSKELNIEARPDKIYHIHPEKDFSCEMDKCNCKVEFSWHDVSVGCNGSLICPKLGGFPCGDYGVSVKFSDSKDYELLCQENYISTGYVEVGQSATFQIWHTASSSKDWSCYFWCSADIKTNDNCNCGSAIPDDAISEMSADAIEAHPWQIQILKESNGGYEFICSGALISGETAVTAADCFADCSGENIDFTKFKLVLGKNCLLLPKDNVLISNIEKIWLHPNFQFKNSQPINNIALVQLSSKLKSYTSRASPVCLPLSIHEEIEDISAQMSGWGTELLENEECGYIWYDKTNKTWLKPAPRSVHQHMLESTEVLLMKQPNSQNVSEANNNMLFGKTMISLNSNGARQCKGDTGSPLTIRGKNGKATLIGITSFGNGQCNSEDMIAFTKISSYLKWITDMSGLQCP